MPTGSDVVRRIQKAFDKWGVDYKTASGAASRGSGNMISIESIMCHHTAGALYGNAPSRNVVTYGRPGLRNALCNLFLPRDGVWEIIAGRRAWHAGSVRATRWDNYRSLGVEAENTGLANDMPWPKDQYDSYVLGCAAIADEFNIPISDVIGHKEACSPRGRKIDPTFSMSAFRTAVRNAKPDGSAAPKSEESKGLFGMSMQSSMTRNKDMKLPKRKWKTVPVDDKGNTSIISGLKPGDGALINAHFDLNGVPKGANVQVRFYTVSYKAGTKTRRLWTHYMTEIVGTDGITYSLVPFLRRNGSKAASGRSIRIRCEIRVFQDGITLRRAQFNRAKG